MAALSQYLASDAQTLKNLQGTRLQSIRLSRFQGAWFGIQAEQGRIGDTVTGEQQSKEEATRASADHYDLPVVVCLWGAVRSNPWQWKCSRRQDSEVSRCIGGLLEDGHLGGSVMESGSKTYRCLGRPALFEPLRYTSMLSSGVLGMPNLHTVLSTPLPLRSPLLPADDREPWTGFPHTPKPTQPDWRSR
jgi:hypothetical protein